MARQNRDDPHSLEEQLAWLDAIKENEDVPGGLDSAADEPVSPYPKDPWLAVPADPAPSPPPMFRAAVEAVFSPPGTPSSVAVADDGDAADTAAIGDPFPTRPVKETLSTVGDASPLSRTAGAAADDLAGGSAASSDDSTGSAAGVSPASSSSEPGRSGGTSPSLSTSRVSSLADAPTDVSGGDEPAAESRRSGDTFGGAERGSSVAETSTDTIDRVGESPDSGPVKKPDSGPASPAPDAGGSAGTTGTTGRGGPASGADRSDDAYSGISGLGAFAVGGLGTTTPTSATGSGVGDKAFGGAAEPSKQADDADRTTSSPARGVDSYLGPLPKLDASDPLGLGALADKRRDTEARPAGTLGAFGSTARTSATSGSSTSTPESAGDEPLRGWLEPAVPASTAGPSSGDDDDEEQRRFDAFMAGADLRDQDTLPRRGTRKPETDPAADPSRTTPPTGSPLGGAESSPRLHRPLDPLTDPLTDPRFSVGSTSAASPSATSSTWTDPQLRPPGDPLRQHAASGLGTGPQTQPRPDAGSTYGDYGDTAPQTPPRTDTGSAYGDYGDTAPQTPPGTDTGSAYGDTAPHTPPRIDTGPQPPQTAPGTFGTPGTPADTGTGPHATPRVDPTPAQSAAEPAAERSGQDRRARSHRRPVPQQPFSPPPRPPANPNQPTADSLDPQTLLKGRRNAPASGWRRLVYKASGGWIKPGEPAEVRRRRELVNRARTPVANGHHRVAVLSLKGGVGKTTTTVGLGATLAQVRGDRVIAVDANPDRGTLSDKVVLETSATVRDLLNERDQIQRYVDIRAFTSQAPSRLEILASDRDPSISEAFSAEDYQIIAEILENYYSICITDCGTGLLHSAMSGVLNMADQIVLVSSPSVDGARAASATLDWLEAHHYGDLVKAASVVLCSVRPRSKSTIDLDRLEAHFAARCRSVVRVPYDPHLEEGAEIDLDRLQPATLDAYLQLAASVGDGFAGPQY